MPEPRPGLRRCLLANLIALIAFTAPQAPAALSEPGCAPATCMDHGGPQPIVAWTKIDPYERLNLGLATADFALDGDRAWMVNQRYGGLSRYDVSDPLDIRSTIWTYDGQPRQYVIKSGNFVIVAGYALEIFDASGPGQPVRLSNRSMFYATGRPEVSANLLLVPDFNNIKGFDISDPTRPYPLAGALAGNLALHGVVNGRLVVLTADELRLHEAAGFPSSRLIGKAPVAATMAVVSDGIAYLATATGILAYDVVTAPDPVLVGRLDGCRPVGRIEASGGLLAFGDRDNGFVVCDVSDPASPRVLTCSQSTRDISDIERCGDYFLVATAGGALHTIDPRITAAARTPIEFSPMIGINYGQPARVGDILAIGRSAAGATPPHSLLTIDISDPDRPTVLGELPLAQAPATLAVRGTLLITPGLGVIDIADPARPREVIAPPLRLRVAVRDTIALAAPLSGSLRQLVAWDISDPLRQRLLGSFILDMDAARILFDGDIMVVTDNRRLRIMDATDLLHPRTLSTIDVPVPSVREWTLRDHILYVVGSAGSLSIVDISDPAAPRVRANFLPPGGCTQGSVAIGDGYAYLNNATVGVMVLDVADLDHPRWVGTIPKAADATHTDEGSSYTSPLLVTGDRLLVTRPGVGIALVPRQCGDVDPLVVAQVDINPGDRCHRVPCGPRARGLVEVAVLTDEGFDAASLDPASVRFGPAAAPVRHAPAPPASRHGHGHGRRDNRSWRLRDIDRDGDLDLLLRFDAADLGFACGDTTGSLTGTTRDGAAVCAEGPVATSRHCPRGGGRDGGRDDDDVALKDATAAAHAVAPPALAPNPFNPLTQVTFELAAPGPVTVDVFDLAGRRVSRLAAAGFAAGPHRLEWRGLDEAGRAVPSGVYFVRVDGATGPHVLRAVLLR